MKEKIGFLKGVLFSLWSVFVMVFGVWLVASQSQVISSDDDETVYSTKIYKKNFLKKKSKN